VPVNLIAPTGLEELRAAVLETPRRGCGVARAVAIARGMGRSYGDAAQLRDGLVVDTRWLRGFTLSLPPATSGAAAGQGDAPVASADVADVADVADQAGVATVTAEAGCTLGQLLAAIEPAGWVLPVVPGTQHVTVGGAIAADIHGKNHGAVGTFGRHVRSLGLLTADGEVTEISRHSDGELFGATLGGMGLTGVVVWAQIELAPVRSAALAVDSERVQSLDHAFAALLAPGGPHRVAWLDLLGPRPVRGIVTRAEQLLEDPGARRRAGRSRFAAADAHCTVKARLSVPEWWPGGILRPAIVRAYNAYRFHSVPRRQVGARESFGAHMFPLDGVDSWPRLYGRQGFVQYQLVVPRGAERALESLLALLRRSEVPCYLAVLKDFGPANGAPLSFPIAGWTLALDLPRAAAGLDELLSRFDEVVAGAGGRVYLAKDSHLRPQTLAAMYPRLDEWRAVRDRVDPQRRWCSDLALRTGLMDLSR
jgi:decaprenylphospho-beta-D-ribofuranose 2-oxidase